jgi:hypothetical protein
MHQYRGGGINVWIWSQMGSMTEDGQQARELLETNRILNKSVFKQIRV